MSLECDKFNKEIISPEEYLKLTDSDKANIESSKIIPPSLGSNDFGKIEINYKYPIYKDMYGKPIGK